MLLDVRCTFQFNHVTSCMNTGREHVKSALYIRSSRTVIINTCL